VCNEFSLPIKPPAKKEQRTIMLDRCTNILRRLSRVTIIYCIVMIGILAWPATFYILIIVVLLWLKRRKGGPSTALGSARFATEQELKQANMIGGPSGLILGRLPGQRGSSPHNLVRIPQAVHIAAFAPSGAGKGVSLVVPTLLSNPENCLVTDFKGELAIATAAHRRKRFGHHIVLLDPYRKVTNHPDTLNPLTGIDKDDPRAIDDANDLSSALVVRTGFEQDPHWSDSAESVIAAVTATTIAYGEKDTRSLHTVRDIISNPAKLELATRLMLESDRWNGALNQMGGHLLTLADKERASVLSSALRHLRFLGSPAIAESVATSSFNPAELRRDGKFTIYLIIPPDRAQAQAGLLRMWISTLLRACIRGGLQ
jgi:type IV secretion system protein VirD4